jgi:hypothetical protein
MGWSRPQLKSLLDMRINQLLKNKYTNSEVFFEDIFPNKIDKVTPLDYILDRTLMRPRDAIIFVNECLIEAQGKTEITGSMIKQAELAYSQGRLESLKFEWRTEHQLLEKYIELLHHKNSKFKVSSILDEELEQVILGLIEIPKEQGDLAVESANDYVKSSYPSSLSFMTQVRQNILYTLYKIGIVGIKVDGTSTVKWSHDRTQNLTPKLIEQTSIVYIHKMLWRSLAIDKRPS